MDILNLIFNANSLQTLIIIVAIITGYVFLNSKIDKKFAEMDKKLAETGKQIAALKDAIMALVFIFKRDNLINEQDERFVKDQLAKSSFL